MLSDGLMRKLGNCLRTAAGVTAPLEHVALSTHLPFEYSIVSIELLCIALDSVLVYKELAAEFFTEHTSVLALGRLLRSLLCVGSTGAGAGAGVGASIAALLRIAERGCDTRA